MDPTALFIATSNQRMIPAFEQDMPISAAPLTFSWFFKHHQLFDLLEIFLFFFPNFLTLSMKLANIKSWSIFLSAQPHTRNLLQTEHQCLCLDNLRLQKYLKLAINLLLLDLLDQLLQGEASRYQKRHVSFEIIYPVKLDLLFVYHIIHIKAGRYFVCILRLFAGVGCCACGLCTF